MTAGGTVVVLNGAPRSGKSTLAHAIQGQSDSTWQIRGVDAVMADTPQVLLPGIGLRPGGERPDLEPSIAALYKELFASIATAAAAGQNTLVDVGLHDDYSVPLGVVTRVADALADTRAFIVGVHCPLDVIVERRQASGEIYESLGVDGSVSPSVVRWQHEVHNPGIYDLVVDTGSRSASDLAADVVHLIETQQPSAFARIRALGEPEL